MALIKCEECNQSISDKAYDCPHCGYPMHTKATQPRRSSPIFGYVALVVGLYILFPSIYAFAGRMLSALNVPDVRLLWHAPFSGLLVHPTFWNIDLMKLGALFLVIYGVLRIMRRRIVL